MLKTRKPVKRECVSKPALCARLVSAETCVHVLRFTFFFFSCIVSALGGQEYCSHTVKYCSYTVWHCSRVKKILKMSPTILFTHLKIILLQCFQFSVSATISSIQTDPIYLYLSEFPIGHELKTSQSFQSCVVLAAKCVWAPILCICQ